ncbi:hypothetical protein DPMN_029170 [Dreissena polymorpha]|uniref:RRM domain-containing protein n=1 Tax=Dreissena polymorpha TaxID=45954 RepID=A0A9D4RF10_DREPO|nr:hypothetical protein DPMN_029170 [Dreissena polymorpha]
MMAHQTKRSRSFGFVTYQELSKVEDCIACRPHVVYRRTVDTKRDMPKVGKNAMNEKKESVYKLFVGGIKDQSTSASIEKEMTQFGAVRHVELKMDKTTGMHKGFCFVTFEETDYVDKAVLIKNIKIDGKEVEMKKAAANPSRGGGRYRDCMDSGKGMCG